MNYFCKIKKLNWIDNLRNFIQEDINFQLNNISLMKKIYDKQDHNQIRLNHNITGNLLELINEELLKENIGPLWYAQSYIRKKGTKQPIHVDGNPMTGLVNAAINIPIKGSANSKHYYYKGSYDLKWVKKKDNSYFEINWSENPIVDEYLELIDTHIVRTNIPHNVEASIDEDRWACTIRFRGNPNFEKLCLAFGT
jgi:hypothetical protein